MDACRSHMEIYHNLECVEIDNRTPDLYDEVQAIISGQVCDPENDSRALAVVKQEPLDDDLPVKLEFNTVTVYVDGDSHSNQGYIVDTGDVTSSQGIKPITIEPGTSAINIVPLSDNSNPSADGDEETSDPLESIPKNVTEISPIARQYPALLDRLSSVAVRDFNITPSQAIAHHISPVAQPVVGLYSSLPTALTRAPVEATSTAPSLPTTTSQRSLQPRVERLNVCKVCESLYMVYMPEGVCVHKEIVKISIGRKDQVNLMYQFFLTFKIHVF